MCANVPRRVRGERTSYPINLVPVKTCFHLMLARFVPTPPFSPQLDVDCANQPHTDHVALSCISSVMRRIDTPKICGGNESRGLGLAIDTPKTLLDLRSRSGEIVLPSITVRFHVCDGTISCIPQCYAALRH